MPVWSFDGTEIIQFGAGDIAFQAARWKPLPGFVGLMMLRCEPGPVGDRSPETMTDVDDKPFAGLFFDRVESCDVMIEAISLVRSRLAEAQGVAPTTNDPVEPEPSP
jgi:hypothetical protein